MTEKSYPYEDGDVTVIGPECFAAADGSVVCWRGENYTPQQPTTRAPLSPAAWRNNLTVLQGLSYYEVAELLRAEIAKDEDGSVDPLRPQSELGPKENR